jgi:hypothetical protein
MGRPQSLRGIILLFEKCGGKGKAGRAAEFADYAGSADESEPNLTVFPKPLQFAKHERIHAPNLRL